MGGPALGKIGRPRRALLALLQTEIRLLPVKAARASRFAQQIRHSRAERPNLREFIQLHYVGEEGRPLEGQVRFLLQIFDRC